MKKYRIGDFVGLHDELVLIAKYLGAVSAEDAVQDAWLKMLKIEEHEGNIDRFLYGKSRDKLNIGYMYSIIRTSAREQREAVSGRMSLQDIPDIEEVSAGTLEADVADVMRGLDGIGRCDKEMFLDYIFGIYKVKELAVQRRVDPSSIYYRIRRVKRKITDRV